MFWLGAISATVLFLAALWFLRTKRLAKPSEPKVTPLSQQHFDIFQGEDLDPIQLESMQTKLRNQLSHESPDTIARSVKTDLEFIYHIEALALIATDGAAETLVQILHGKLGGDPLEQGWILFDLIRALKTLHHAEGIEALLTQVVGLGKENPLAIYCATEMIGFPGIGKHFPVKQGSGTKNFLPMPIWNVLLVAIEGFCLGVNARLVSESQLGDLLETLWSNLSNRFEPDFLLCLAEAFRVTKRGELLRRQMEDEDQVVRLGWQLAKIESLEESLGEHRKEAMESLLRDAKGKNPFKRRTALNALVRLRWDTELGLVSLLNEKPFLTDSDLIFPILCMTKNRSWFPQLIEFLHSVVGSKSSKSNEDDVLRVVFCKALDLLRRFPGHPAEKVLLMCAKSKDPKLRSSALRNLGWWEPMDRPAVLGALRLGAAAKKPAEVRWVAKAALARLGERKSLNSFRSLLYSEDQSKVHLGIQTVGNEGISLLWPDLDQLRDSNNEGISYHAWEATEKLGLEAELGN